MNPKVFRTSSALFHTLRRHALLLACLVGPAALLSTAAATTVPSPAVPHKQVSAGSMQSPLHFEAAVSPSGRQQFISLGAGYAMTFSPGNATVSLRSGGGKDATIRMTMVDSDHSGPIVGEARLKTVSNYLIGNDSSAWRTGVTQFERIRYESAYPGVDLTFYGNQQHLEYDFEVAPNADPSAIRLHFDGADKLTAKSNGDLSLATVAGALEFARPVVYQLSPSGARLPIAAKFALRNHDVTFALGRYDHTRPLIIDPILNYVTYLGGSGDENNFGDPKTLTYQSGIAVGADGSTYVTGVTSKLDFPNVKTKLANVQPPAPSYVFVTKFDAGGNVVYSTYLGGTDGANYGGGIAVNAAGEAYVAGSTFATDFLVTSNALQPSKHGVGSGFVSKLNAAGDDLIYSTYLGGTVNTRATAVAVDTSGNAYVTGEDEGGTFLTTTGAYQTSIKPNAYQNAFVVKLTPTGQLFYGTYLGGEYLDAGLGIAVDLSQNAYVTGWTSSHHFPVTNSTALTGQSNAFVSLLSADGKTLTFSRYLGGSGTDRGYGIAVDHDSNIYVAGITSSADFPTKNALQSSKAAPAGQSNGFVTELDAISLHFSTYLGGGVGDAALAVAVDQTENIYVTGYAGSVNTANAFPQTYGMTFPTNNSYLSGFVTVYSQVGASYIYSTLLGGNTGNTIGTGIAVDNKGNAFVTGGTATKDLPTTTGAPQPVTAGKNDAFVAKLFSLNFDNAALHFPDTAAGTSSAPLTTTLTNASSSGPVTITKQGFSNTTDFSETDNCSSLSAQASCTFTFRFNPQSTGARSSVFTYTTSASPVPQTVQLSGKGTTPAATPKVALSPSSIDFGTVQQNTNGSQLLTIYNNGTAALHVSSITLGGANASAFSYAGNAACATIAANASCSVSVGFNASAAATYNATLTLVDDAPDSPQVVPLTGKGQPGAPQAAVSATSLNFGSLTAGDNKTLNFALTNSGTDTLHVSNVALSGTSAVFTFNLPCTTVAVGGSCSGSVAYKPVSVGNDIATLVITDDSPNPTQSIQLFGAATAPAPQPTPQAVLTPASYTFVDTVAGSTASQAFTLSNPGNAPLSITGISIPSGAFTQTSNCGSALAVGASCTITVTFTPVAVSSYTATLMVVDNAATPQQTASISGHGIAPAGFSLNVAVPATTVQAGSSASFSIAASSTNGSYNNPVSFSAKGLPAGFVVTFTPATVTPGSNGATSVMTIQTPSPVASAGASGSTGGLKAAFVLAALTSLPLFAVFGLRRTARRNLRRVCLMALALCALLPVFSTTGCGGGGYFAPTAQTYTITVTGTSGSLQQSTNVTLTVN